MIYGISPEVHGSMRINGRINMIYKTRLKSSVGFISLFVFLFFFVKAINMINKVSPSVAEFCNLLCDCQTELFFLPS